MFSAFVEGFLTGVVVVFLLGAIFGYLGRPKPDMEGPVNV